MKATRYFRISIFAFLIGAVMGNGVQAQWDWEPYPEKAALMLFIAHPDDECGYFAGLMTWYTVCRKLPVIFVVMTTSDWIPQRHDEARCAAWAYGLRYEPIFMGFPDCCYGGTLEQNWAAWGGYDNAIAKTTGIIRRFKPDVIVGLDFDGEYGHPNHMGAGHAPADAFDAASNPDKYPEQFDSVDVWQAKKCYIHLYPENPFIHEWEPLSCPEMGGRAMMDFANEGCRCHESQPVSSARSTPCELGLYRTTVGPDIVAKNDFFENIDISIYFEDLSAAISALPPSGPAPLSVLFSAEGSISKNSNIQSYQWDFGDGTTGEGMEVDHEFSTSGSYTVQLIVTNAEESDTAKVDIAVKSYRNPEILSASAEGLEYEYFEGTFESVEELVGRTPLKDGTSNNFDLSVADATDNFGLLFKGYIDVPQTGEYTFYLSSDDGSILWIGDSVVVNLDGSHGAAETNGKTYLLKGTHAITVGYFDGSGDQSLDVSWEGSGMNKQYIPDNVLIYSTGTVTPTVSYISAKSLAGMIRISDNTIVLAHDAARTAGYRIRLISAMGETRIIPLVRDGALWRADLSSMKGIYFVELGGTDGGSVARKVVRLF